MKKKLLIGLGVAIIIVVTVVAITIPRYDPEIRTWHDLHAVRYHLGKSFVLMNDLDSTTAGYEELAGPTAHDGKGWQPIGTRDNPFTGTFDGRGHEIRGLYINRPEESRVGLFGDVREPGVIGNAAVVNATVIGDNDVGSLVGAIHGATVSNSYGTGNVSGQMETGGLAGGNYGGTLSNCHAIGSVSGRYNVGGLAGDNFGLVSNSHFSGSVSGGNNVGGLVGTSYEGPVSNSYAIGSVTGDDRVGGLIGKNEGTVSKCHFIGSVSGQNSVGGLVGLHDGVVRQAHLITLVAGVHGVNGMGGEDFLLSPPLIPPNGIVSSCYSAGTVTGDQDVGGLVGLNRALVGNSYSSVDVTGCRNVGGLIGTVGGPEHYWTGYLRECYSIGQVGGDDNVGGLIGWLDRGEADESFWDTETSGMEESVGGTGKTTAEMKAKATFIDAGWDFDDIWNINDVNDGYPFLRWQLENQ